MSQTRYLKSMITPTLVEPTTGDANIAGTASGVWSVQDQLEAKRGGAWPDASVANPDEFIENNFSTFLYTGNASSRNIENDINLSGKGGLVWIKDRSVGKWHKLFDTERGVNNALITHEVDTPYSVSPTLTAFNSNGFTLGAGGAQNNKSVNENNETYCAWTFKQAPKFFDVVTYTGNDTAGRTIAHSLGSVPGMIIIKNISDADNWMVYHRGLNGGTNPENYYIRLNLNNAEVNDTRFTNGTAPTSSVFSVSNHGSVNGDNKEYIAYIFAHETGDDSMIQCGSYTGNGNSDGPEINLGFEPQWLMYKNTNGTDNWEIVDTMRGMPIDGNDMRILKANISGTEAADNAVGPTATGFKVTNSGGSNNDNNSVYIYMAIRRPNMATITDATKVFAMDSDGSALVNDVALTSGFPVDMVFHKELTGTDASNIASRLQGSGNRVQPSSNAAEASGVTYGTFDHNDGFFSTPVANMGWMWKRAKGFFDVVAYTGTGSARTVAHGLTVAPEMMWIKVRSIVEPWVVYHKGFNGGTTPEDFHTRLTDGAPADDNDIFNDTAPTSSVFTTGGNDKVNKNNATYIAYLFATLAGVSKVGSVTHSGSSTDVDCGFTSGARFVLLKRIDASGDFYIWDSVRGIIAGNDPYLLLNDAAAQVTNTDFIDPLSSGFQISGSFQDGDYIFYAIA